MQSSLESSSSDATRRFGGGGGPFGRGTEPEREVLRRGGGGRAGGVRLPPRVRADAATAAVTRGLNLCGLREGSLLSFNRLTTTVSTRGGPFLELEDRLFFGGTFGTAGGGTMGSSESESSSELNAGGGPFGNGGVGRELFLLGGGTGIARRLGILG